MTDTGPRGTLWSPHKPPMRTLPLLLLLAGCTTWRPVVLPTPDFPDWNTTGALRVTTTAGRVLHGDTLRLTPDSARLFGSAGRIAFPRGDLGHVERHAVAPGRTTLLVSTLLLMAIAVIDYSTSPLFDTSGGY